MERLLGALRLFALGLLIGLAVNAPLYVLAAVGVLEQRGPVAAAVFAAVPLALGLLAAAPRAFTRGEGGGPGE